MAGKPNERLSLALRQAGLSNKELARQINARARARGYNVAVDASRVGRWLKGEHPREPVPGLLVGLLRERIGQPLTLTDIGLRNTGSDPLEPSWASEDTLESLRAFAGSDLMLTRRDLTQLAVGAPLVLAAERLWERAVPAASEISGKVGLDETRGIERLVSHFRALDAAHGGTSFRRSIVAQLDTVIELIAGGQSPVVAHRLLQAAADLAGLAGWMSHDAGLYGTAQRYWAFSISLARQADDAGRGAEVMSRMAHQMVYLGHPKHALDLLDVACKAADSARNLRLQAMLTAQRGRMLAALGDAQASLMMLCRAEELLLRAEESGEPAADWIAYFSPAELAGATAVSHRDLKALHGKDIGPASRHFEQAVDRRPAGYDRVRAMDMVGMAAAYLDEDEPEQACAVAENALDLAEQLDSTLIRSRVLVFVSAAERFSQYPQIAELRDRVHSWASEPNLQAA